MLKERIDDLVDILAEEYSRLENTFLIKNNQQLMKYLENPAKWKQEQMAHRLQFKKEIAQEAQQRIKILNEKYNKVLLLAYREVDKNIIEINEKDITINSFQKEIQKAMSDMAKTHTDMVKQLANSAFKTYTREVKVISSTYKTDKIFEGIKRQMPKGIQNGLKIVYRDGKQMSFKSYMEMNARTTLQHETSERQIDAGTRAGQIFYICDSFSDCAKDHAMYQGKIYYNADVPLPKEVEDYIRSHNILSMQEVRDDEPFLTTRPNCRHNFHAIPTDEVLDSKDATEILNKEGFNFGKYDAKNYDDLQQQRYNERKIREWKTRLENQKQIAKSTGIPNPQAEKKANDKVREWQEKQRKLINSNPNVLERNYERESAKIIVEDLGVRYHYKVENGQLVKK